MASQRVRESDLLALFTERALVEVRWMAGANELYVENEELDPSVEEDVDVLARIRLLTDITHGFANVLGMNPLRRRRAARQALSWRWSVTGESGHRWMRARAGVWSPGHLAMLEDVVGRGVIHHGGPGRQGG